MSGLRIPASEAEKYGKKAPKPAQVPKEEPPKAPFLDLSGLEKLISANTKVIEKVLESVGELKVEVSAPQVTVQAPEVALPAPRLKNFYVDVERNSEGRISAMTVEEYFND